MKATLLSFALLLALLTIGPRAIAQSTTPTALAEQGQKEQKELERKALLLLDEIIKDAQSYKVAENRLRLTAIAASLLWKHDEARARLLFKETMAGVAELVKTETESDELVSRFSPLHGATRLRREIVQMLATRDPRMARDFLRATKTVAKAQTGGEREANQPASSMDTDLQLEYSLATQLSETDPKQAFEIAQESLAQGYSYELINTLKQLRAKDQELAAQLARDLVTKLRTENLVTNQDAAAVATSLLLIVFNLTGETVDKKAATPLLDEQGMRDLMEANINLALTSPNYSGHLRTLVAMMPQVQKYAPGRVTELRRRLAQFKGAEEAAAGDGGSYTPGDWEKYRDLMQKGTADELLAAVPKAPQYIRDNLYQMAATKLIEKGEFERAREIVTKHLADTPYRRQLLAEIDRQASLTAAAQGQMEQFRKTLVNLKTIEERAVALAQAAAALATKGEKKVARQLLAEAQNMVNYRAKNAKQLAAQLLVAQSYAKLEPERSLLMLEPIVDQLNELVAAATTLGGFFFGDEMMRDDEVRMEIFSELVSSFSGSYIPDLRSLARFDFERTRALADRFQRDEVRMMARLLVVQSVLVGPHEQKSAPEQSEFTTTDLVEP